VPVTVLLYGPIRKWAGDLTSVTVEHKPETTVDGLLDLVNQMCPGFKEKIVDEEGKQNRFVAIHVKGEDIRLSQGLETPIPDNSEVSVLSGVAGG